MANPSASLAYVELAPHSLHIAVLSGRKVIAMRAFGLDAKADLAAFIAEHQLVGVVRASLLGMGNFVHLSAEGESGAVRQPAALQSHAAKLPHGFDSAPAAVVCDAATGGALDATRAAPWLLVAVDGAAYAAAKDTLGTLGLAPADLTLAAPAHLGAVASSLSGNEVALVLVPGEDEAALVWVGASGVQAVASAPVGYAQIYEAVQKGLGLKFKAAAGKLFYNDNYDFAEAAPKIAAPLAEALKPVLEGSPATSLHIAGLTPGQAWLDESLSAALGLKPWTASGSALAARLGLETGVMPLPISASGVLALASAGSSDAPWVQPTLETLIARPPARAKTNAPFARSSVSTPPVVASAPAAMAVPGPAPMPVVPPPAPAAKPAVAAKPVAPAPAPAARPVAKPAPAPAAKPALKPVPQSVVAVAAGSDDGQSGEAPVAAHARSFASSSSAPVARKSKTGSMLIAGGVVLVVTVVGLAMHFRSPKDRPDKTDTATAPAAAPAAPATAPAPAPSSGTAPAVVAVPAPAPLVIPPAAPAPVVAPAPGNVDQFAADARKFGNDRYRFEVTEKGFIQALATTRDEVLVESAAGVSLQGSYVGTDGRRKWFNVGGVDDVGYQATVKKSVRDGATVFEVKVSHPRFELEQTFLCLADAVKVSAKFTPINLRDPRGVIAAVHSVRLSPVALNPSLRMRAAADSFAYAMKSGTLRVGFDNGVWARDGADGRQTIIAGENGVAFHFTESSDATRNQLAYEIAVP